MKIIVTAGGTGGHVMPAVSIAGAIRKKRPDAEILFIGTDRGLEEKVAKANDLRFYALKAAGIKGKGIKDLFRAATINIGAFSKALKIVRDFRPDWIIGAGGYVTGMVVLAGRLAGSRCAIQEQNILPGLTNRILSHLSQKIFWHFLILAGFSQRKKWL
jgi:UDP-N-acetylglucosamine--N-acetylmuramyl-(pentapeptide) pyrophosphoryl-undecaprenol N-acetylglucosamine transferase